MTTVNESCRGWPFFLRHHSAAAALAMLLCLTSTKAFALQVKYDSWSKALAAAETREFQQKVKDVGPLDASTKAYLEEIALPQLGLPNNRDSIDQVRRQIRERLLGGFTSDDRLDEVNRIVLAYMQKMASDETVEMSVRVNAVLLIGELQSRTGSGWSESMPALSVIVADEAAPMPLRIAAMIGVTDRLGAASQRTESEILRSMLQEAQPALIAALDSTTDPAEADAQPADWLATRALRTLTSVLPSAPPEMAERFMRILGDDRRDIDLRVWAAAALGHTVDAQSGIDASAAIDLVEDVAIEALAADMALADRRRFERDFFVGGPGGMPGMMGGGIGSRRDRDSAEPGAGYGGQMPYGEDLESESSETTPDGNAAASKQRRGERGEDDASGRGTPRGTTAARGGRGGRAQPSRGGPAMGPGGMAPLSGFSMDQADLAALGMQMGFGMDMLPNVGGRLGGAKPTRPPLIEKAVCMRTVWRLQKLSIALVEETSPTKGLVQLVDEAARPAVVEMSKRLWEQSLNIDGKPNERSVRAALAAIAPTLAGPKQAEDASAEGAAPDDQSADPGTGEDGTKQEKPKAGEGTPDRNSFDPFGDG